jgi:hypothetical protein
MLVMNPTEIDIAMLNRARSMVFLTRNPPAGYAKPRRLDALAGAD